MINYIKESKIPPKSKAALSPPEKLVENLKTLIGQKFSLTGKSRTDGSNFRKMIVNHLLSSYLPEGADDYEIVPPGRKGVPSFLREYIDTYLATTRANYNLEVWNRIPNSPSVQVDLKNGERLLASDVRFVLGKVNREGVIEAIVIMTPDYIENKFGRFGKPTIKQQLIISPQKREEIIKERKMVLTDKDLSVDLLDTESNTVAGDAGIKDEPEKVLPIETIDMQITEKLIGEKLDISLSTKQRGQQLERMVAFHLGYRKFQEELEGGYPDIRNQMLEIKVQDTQTIDLGRYSPQFEEQISPDFTTRTIRYLIALTDSTNGEIDGIILSPGSELKKHFTYVTGVSFKCQKSIPMKFFEKIKGEAVYNPAI